MTTSAAALLSQQRFPGAFREAEAITNTRGRSFRSFHNGGIGNLKVAN